MVLGKIMQYLTGIGFTLLSTLAFALMYAFYKLCLPFLSISSILCVQNAFSWVLILPFVFHKGRSFLATTHLGPICLRSLFALLSAYCITFAITRTSLAEVTLLNNIAPLCVPFLARIWYKEKINHRLWPALILGFLGVTVVLQPWAIGIIGWGPLTAAFSGVLLAGTMLVTRQISQEPLLKILFYLFSIFAVLTFPFAILSWQSPPQFIWLYLFCSALLMVGSQLSLTVALRHAPAQIIAPFIYMLVIFSMIIDWIGWGEVPNLTSILGMIVIACSGIATILLSRKTRKALIIVEPLGVGAQFKAEAKSLGYQVIGVFQFSDEIYQSAFHSLNTDRIKGCDHTIHSGNAEEIIREIKKKKWKVQGCIAGSEPGVELAETLALSMGLLCNSKGTALALRDKGMMRESLKKSGLACPDFAVCATLAELEAFLNSHSLPLVVKTPKGAGTAQVFICENKEDLIQGFLNIIQNESLFGMSALHAVVEEYIGGKEYIVDTFSDGEQTHVTDVWVYDRVSSPTFKNIYYNTISIPISDPSIEHIKAYALKVAALFQLKLGPAHAEIKDDPKKGPMLIEIGARLAGAHVGTLISEHSNFNPFRGTIEVFTKGKTQFPDPMVLHKHLALGHGPVLESGIVEQISGIEEIRKLPSFLRHFINIQIGDRIEASTDLSTIPYLALFANSNQEQLMADVKKMHELFKVKVLHIDFRQSI